MAEEKEKREVPISEPRKFTLKFGYTDKEEKSVVHQAVTMSKRPTGKDFLVASDLGGGTSSTRYTMAMVASAITAFGTVKMPVPLTVLLNLNRIDREKLLSEYLLFTVIDAKPEQLETGKVQLVFGVERDGVRYDVVEFGHLLTGYDEVAIEESTETVQQETAFKMALEVVRISTSDGIASLEGALTREEIESLDFDDYDALQKAEGVWLNSFRK